MKAISSWIYSVGIQSPVLRRFLARPATGIRRSNLALNLARRVFGRGNAWAISSTQNEFDNLRKKYAVDFQSLLVRKPDSPIGLIALPSDPVVSSFLAACEALNLKGVVLDPLSHTFFKEAFAHNFEFYICCQNHDQMYVRQMFREKETALRYMPSARIFPNVVEQQIYEAKRELAYFLEIAHIPHPKTFVFYKKQDALNYLNSCTYPQVFKAHNGAGGQSVEILNNQRQAVRLVNDLFDRYYINKSLSDYRDIDYGYILLQEWIPNVREHRVIKIGDSWFAHEKAKLEHQEFMSGSGVVKWSSPPEQLLSFCYEIAEEHSFNTMCFDVFEKPDGEYMINELQTWFGSYNPSQMYIEGVPGRYVRRDEGWCFEAGLYNEFGSMALRIVAAINSL